MEAIDKNISEGKNTKIDRMLLEFSNNLSKETFLRFETELKEKIIGATSHVTIKSSTELVPIITDEYGSDGDFTWPFPFEDGETPPYVLYQNV